MTNEQALLIIKEIKENDIEAWEKLSNKCNWEQQTIVSVVKSWGDPREW